jgi:hypothetical protein
MVRFVEEWQVQFRQIDQLDIEAIVGDCPGAEPGREPRAHAAGSGAADDDGQNWLRHQELVSLLQDQGR